MIRNIFLCAVSMLGLAGTAAAQTPQAPPLSQEQRVDNRQERQSDRIDQGVAAGELTRREQARLERQQKHIQGLERRVEADGTVTRKEAYRLERAQDHASRSIARQKHDRQTRP